MAKHLNNWMSNISNHQGNVYQVTVKYHLTPVTKEKVIIYQYYIISHENEMRLIVSTRMKMGKEI